MSILITISRQAHCAPAPHYNALLQSAKYFPQPHLIYLEKCQSTQPARLRSLRVLQDKPECSHLCFIIGRLIKAGCAAEIVTNNSHHCYCCWLRYGLNDIRNWSQCWTGGNCCFIKCQFDSKQFGPVSQSVSEYWQQQR